jgi:hypothetical protein
MIGTEFSHIRQGSRTSAKLTRLPSSHLSPTGENYAVQ